MSQTTRGRQTETVKRRRAAVRAGSAPHTLDLCMHTETAVHAAHANMQGGEISLIYAAFVQVSNAEQPQQCAHGDSKQTHLHHICVCNDGRRLSEVL